MPAGVYPRPSAVQRFWSKVDRSEPNGCWPWLGGQFKKADGRNYGAFFINGQNRPAHQIAWELTNGRPFPRGKQGNHACDFTLCCRPEHVSPGTQADNMTDMVVRGRSLRGERHPSTRHPDRISRGESRWNAKLTPSIVVAMRDRYQRGGTTTIALGLEFGVDHKTVWRIVNRRAWKHIG